eukprot:4972952-Prymnesium_polylepis.1
MHLGPSVPQCVVISSRMSSCSLKAAVPSLGSRSLSAIAASTLEGDLELRPDGCAELAEVAADGFRVDGEGKTGERLAVNERLGRRPGGLSLQVT